MGRPMLLLMALPAVVLAIARLVLLALAVQGAHPFWPWERLTLSEAAALRDAGEVSRLLAEGQDPNRRYEVRRGFLKSGALHITPMEAAVAARRPEIVQLLLDGGARTD